MSLRNCHCVSSRISFRRSNPTWDARERGEEPTGLLDSKNVVDHSEGGMPTCEKNVKSGNVHGHDKRTGFVSSIGIKFRWGPRQLVGWFLQSERCRFYCVIACRTTRTSGWRDKACAATRSLSPFDSLVVDWRNMGSVGLLFARLSCFAASR